MNFVEYHLQRKAAGDARTIDEIKAEYDTAFAAAMAKMESDLDAASKLPAKVARHQKAIDDSNAVDAWLKKLKGTDTAEFENVRRKNFEDLKILAGV